MWRCAYIIATLLSACVPVAGTLVRFEWDPPQYSDGTLATGVVGYVVYWQQQEGPTGAVFAPASVLLATVTTQVSVTEMQARGAALYADGVWSLPTPWLHVDGSAPGSGRLLAFGPVPPPAAWYQQAEAGQVVGMEVLTSGGCGSCLESGAVGVTTANTGTARYEFTVAPGEYALWMKTASEGGSEAANTMRLLVGGVVVGLVDFWRSGEPPHHDWTWKPARVGGVPITFDGGSRVVTLEGVDAGAWVDALYVLPVGEGGGGLP